MQIFHGNIITCDWKCSVFNYLVEDEGKIVFVGDKLPEAYSIVPGHVELGSKAMLPAFGDGHIHFSSWAFFNAAFDVRSAATIPEIGPIIEDYALRNQKSKVLFGFGLSNHALAEKRLINRAELDKIIKNRPVFLVTYDGHSAVVNSKTIGILPRRIRDLRGFNLESGQLFSEAFLEASNYISGKVSVPTMLSRIIKGADTLASYGVGLVHAVEGIGFTRDLDVDLVRLVGRSSQLGFRTYFQTMQVEKVLKRKLPRIGGCFACALDGSFGTKDAALSEPYMDDEFNRGILFYKDDQVIDFVKKANRAGLQIQLHCIGDAAVVQAVKALEAALKDYPRKYHRHTLIHACLIPEETLEKIASLEIGINIHPGHLVSPLEPAEYLESILGARVHQIWPINKMLDMGINVSAGSDGPVITANPVEGIYGACNHYIADHAVSTADALCMYTYNIAHTSFDENERGSLEPGKSADMIIVNKNPLQLDPHDLRQLEVEKTFLAGQKYSGKKTIPQTLLEGYKNRNQPV